MQLHTPIRAALTLASCAALLTATSALAQARSTSATSTSSSSSKSASTAAPSFSVPAATSASVNIPELPVCNGAKEDNALLWDNKARKWMCRALSALLPPKCDGIDQALRFDGKAWKCETVGGLLVAHAVTYDDLKGKNTCSAENTWGGATCTVTSNGMGAKLTCPANTTKVEVGALNSYAIKTSDWYDEFGAEYHVFCYSRPINVAK